MRPTDVHPPVCHPPPPEDTRRRGERRRRCAWLLRNGHADAAMDAVEQAANERSYRPPAETDVTY